MFFSFRSKPEYSSVPAGEYHDEECKAGEPLHQVIWTQKRSSKACSFLKAAAVFTLIGVGAVSLVALTNFSKATTACRPCVQPAIRQEWRTLTLADRNEYIASVQCLMTKPSTIFPNGSMYDDFPRVHQATAPTAHQAAPFLPWHRYFVHAYEQALKTECGFSGAMPYWDWSQDWKEIANAPVWETEGGFGGDGDRNSPITVGEGRCVRDGPFANLEAKYYGDQVAPHCLSRGFASGAELKGIAELISPNALEELRQRSSSFETYAPEIEHRAHSFMRNGVRGDFRAYTGPYDPVFFLHHVNLDRLWSLWQTSATDGAIAYGGPRYNATNAPTATLDDILDVGGLLPNIQVAAVMDTMDSTFCYQY